MPFTSEFDIVFARKENTETEYADMPTMDEIEILDELRTLYPNGHEQFIPMMLNNMKLHSEKNADYAHDGPALGNFYRVSAMLRAFGLDVTPAQVGFIYMMKQVDAAGRMLFKNYSGKVEGIDKRMEDEVVYGNLVRILQKEQS